MLLGASNLTRGFPAVVGAARSAWGAELEVLAALGLGRSYGVDSSILGRRLSGIVGCGLWSALERLPSRPTRALVTDVGNDILYGVAVPRILDWVEVCLERLLRVSPDVVLTDLPLASIGSLGNARYLLFRSLLVPRCRLSHAQVVRSATELADGLGRLAERHHVRFFRLRRAWYGFDPIHIRPGLWSSAWREILFPDGCADGAGLGAVAALRLYLAHPERQWRFGIERRLQQPALRLPGSIHVSLY